MSQAAITRFILSTFEGTHVLVGSKEAGSPELAWGDSFFSYGPEGKPDHKFPFATMVTKDYGDFDAASNLNRPGVFRLNVGVDRQTWEGLQMDVGAPVDFTALDRVMPHPVYGKQHWLCVLNPSKKTFEVLRPLLASAYGVAVKRHTQRQG